MEGFEGMLSSVPTSPVGVAMIRTAGWGYFITSIVQNIESVEMGHLFMLVLKLHGPIKKNKNTFETKILTFILFYIFYLNLLPVSLITLGTCCSIEGVSGF